MTDHEFPDEGRRLYDRIAVAGVALLLAAFLLGVFGVISDAAKASGDDLVAKRDHGDDDDDQGGPDDDDDDDGDSVTANTATGTTRGTGASNTATNDTATGTVTANDTATGTTKGTGASNTATNDTATGTLTRGR